MLKTLVFTILTLALCKVEAAVTARWLTVSSVLIDDGKTRLLFDPAWTRPGLRHWLNLEKFKADPELVKSIVKKNKIEKIDAVFVSHSHFDHVSDAPMVSKVTGAVMYTDKSSERIAKGYKDEKIRTIRMTPEQEIRVGDFVITPLRRIHSQILHLFYFLPGDVPENTNLSFWDYHVGDTWFYLVKHPEMTILVDQGSEPFVNVVKKHTEKIDVIIQGVANRISDEQVIDGYVKHYKPSQFIPLHFDNFFATFAEGEEGDLPGIRLEKLLDKMKKAYPAMKADRPRYSQPIWLLKVER